MDNRTFSEKWSINGDGLIKSGVYERAENMIISYQTVMEIGCGTGHSSQILLATDHKVIAIDIKAECIESAYGMLHTEWNCEIKNKPELDNNTDIVFINADIFDQIDFDNLARAKADIIILWNPGQTQHVSNDAIIDQCVMLSKKMGIPLQILERVKDEEDVQFILEEIADYFNMRIVSKDYWKGLWNQNGVRINQLQDDSLYYVVGLLI